MRVILFSGKGGSGVSTLAAASAIAIAKGGRPTLAFGIGAGLGAAFGAELADGPATVADGLWAIEGRHRHDAPDDFRDWLGDLLAWRGMDPALVEDLSALPGVGYVGRLLEMESHAQGSRYDVVVVDASPLSQLLELPPALDAAARWLERLFAPREQTIFEPFLRVFAGDYATVGDDVLARGRDLLTRLAGLRELLTDPAVSSVRLVATADMPAAGDVQRAIAALTLFGYPVDAVAVNKALPDEVRDPFFAGARAAENETVRHITDSVGPMPVLRASLARSTPRAPDALAALADALYGGRAPVEVLHRGPAPSFSRRDGHHVFSLALPFARREDLRLEQTDDGLAVHLFGQRCVLPLPEEVRYREAQSWSFEEQVLKVTFGP